MATANPQAKTGASVKPVVSKSAGSKTSSSSLSKPKSPSPPKLKTVSSKPSVTSRAAAKPIGKSDSEQETTKQKPAPLHMQPTPSVNIAELAAPMVPLPHLPTEMWLEIFNKFNPQTLAIACGVCKHWNQLAVNHPNWVKWVDLYLNIKNRPPEYTEVLKVLPEPMSLLKESSETSILRDTPTTPNGKGLKRRSICWYCYWRFPNLFRYCSDDGTLHDFICPLCVERLNLTAPIEKTKQILSQVSRAAQALKMYYTPLRTKDFVNPTIGSALGPNNLGSITTLLKVIDHFYCKQKPLNQLTGIPEPVKFVFEKSSQCDRQVKQIKRWMELKTYSAAVQCEKWLQQLKLLKENNRPMPKDTTQLVSIYRALFSCFWTGMQDARFWEEDEYDELMGELE